MQKTKKQLIYLVILTLVFAYTYMPIANAASFTDAKDTISDSDVSATGVAHAVAFTSGVVIPATNGTIDVVFPAGFGSIVSGNVTCPAGMTGVAASQTVTCTAGGSPIATGSLTVGITNMTNPGTAGSYLVNIISKNSGAELEKSDVRVYIIDDVTVTGHVDSSLTFSVTGLNAGITVNSIPTTATSTSTAIPFGTLVPNTSSTLGQELTVGTNATDGYTVTVFQDHELQSAGGANINSFNNSPVGTGSTTPITWADPLNLLSNSNTWGHMGLTSGDADGAIGTAFSGGKYAGLAAAAPLAIMSHTGPSDEITQNIGKAQVAYTIKITALQEAGDYSSTLTYVCTPQF